MSAERIGVVLFNLGGPDKRASIQPFLRNLFSDPAILRMPSILRLPLARFIARRRAPQAGEAYAHLGGFSPLLENTRAQADALEAWLKEDYDAKTVIAMRYWHPRASAAAEALARFRPTRIVLLPLYPHYSTTTTESSFADWLVAAKEAGLSAPTHAVCCYPDSKGFVRAYAARIRAACDTASGAVRVLFSAHGLPERIIRAGDPYQRQIEISAAAIAKEAGLDAACWRVCYQSRVGPMRWIGPDTETCIKEAGARGEEIVLVPISFVSEHVETLVELDRDYKKIAEENGVPEYHRIATPGTEAGFIAALGELVVDALHAPGLHCPAHAPGQPCAARLFEEAPVKRDA